MDFFKALFRKNEPALPTPTKNIPGIEPIVVQAVESLFPDANTQTKTFECIRELKKDRKGVADPVTLLALLKYSKADLELFRKSAWQSHPHFWMDEISHIFRTMDQAEEWVKSISKS
jgi:hypothetical protein